MCLGRHWGSFEPLKMMLKCKIIYISRFWTLSVQKLFRDLIWGRVWYVFLKIWELIWVSSGVPFGGNEGGVEGYRSHVIFDGFKDLAKSQARHVRVLIRARSGPSLNSRPQMQCGG